MRLIRSGALVFGANIADTAAVLLRNVLLARLLSVSDFGIAATFSILVTLMDAAQNAGISRMIVQAPDAESQRLQDSLHGVQLALGVLTGLLLLALAWPYAMAMGTPDIVWAYALLAVLPAVRGAAHLDVFRLQRHGRFAPSVIRQLLPQLISLAAIWPAYLLFRDYRAMIALLFIQQLASVLVSHLAVERPYRLRFDRAITARAFTFGWPLLLNGILMFFVFNGDRMVVSNQFGLEALGWFSAAVTLTLNPAVLIARSLQTVMLPGMARVQDDAARLQRQNDGLVGLVAIVYVAMVAGAALLGEQVLTLVFGERFAPAGPFVLLLAIMQGLRLMRAVPAIAAMAKAETKNPLYTNIVRGLFIPLALVVALWTRDIYWMLAVGIAGEAIAALVAARLAQWKIGLSERYFIIAFGTASIAVTAIAGWRMAGWSPWPIAPAMLLMLFSVRGSIAHARQLLRR